MENKMYLAVGEEAARGTPEVSTVGFIPLNSTAIPKFEPEVRDVTEIKGQQPSIGMDKKLRMSQKWSYSLEMPFFTEAGTTKGMVGTILKHFFGTVSSAQQAATTAYAHMMYPVQDPFASGNLDNDALTLNFNINEGDTMKNWPWVGGRVKSLSIEQEAGNPMVMSAELFGQFKDTTTAEIGSPVYAAENLRCDYYNLKVYTGTVSRTGSAPDYTDFDISSATQINPDKISIKIENPLEDAMRLDGKDYPTKTRVSGRYKVTVEMTLDWEDPSSGFSSVDDYNAYMAAEGDINLCFVWDTGTEAGTAYNHKFVLDIPVAHRMNPEIEYDTEKDPMITLSYEGLVDTAVTGYAVGALLQNTATAI